MWGMTPNWQAAFFPHREIPFLSIFRSRESRWPLRGHGKLNLFMVAEKNKVIAVAYELQVDDGENGKVFKESVPKEQPFLFLFGAGNVLPALEEALSDKAVGDTFEVFIDYENGYGDYDEGKKVIVPKTACLLYTSDAADDL